MRNSLIELTLCLGAVQTGCVTVPYVGTITPTDRATHVLIVPGVFGPNRNTVGNLERLRSSERSAQIWNWIDHPELDTFWAFNYLEPAFVQPAADSLAQMVRNWRRDHPATNLYVAAGSGGALVVILAADALVKDVRAHRQKFFDRVLFASASFDRERDISSVLRASASGLYNYYSSADVVLWWRSNAAGSFGLPRAHEAVKQLQWRAESWFHWLDNDGGHLNCNKPKFFERYIEPVLSPRTADIPPEWR